MSANILANLRIILRMREYARANIIREYANIYKHKQSSFLIMVECKWIFFENEIQKRRLLINIRIFAEAIRTRLLAHSQNYSQIRAHLYHIAPKEMKTKKKLFHNDTYHFIITIAFISENVYVYNFFYIQSYIMKCI